MEFVVTMTTNVPQGTSQETIEDIRAREDAHSRELAAQGNLLRLWRPPLQPGEWRSLGLFAARDAGQLEKVLASMPLRIWRSDEVTPLSPHPNDPAARPGAGRSAAQEAGVEFLTTFIVSIPEGTPRQEEDDARAREAQRTQELAAQGHLLRLWTLPVEGHALGLWRARDTAEMRAIVATLPLDAWMTVSITPLTRHPSDPAALRS
jgi:muconolactone delta-isomerase